MSRLQIAINVTDLDKAVEFYSRLFATVPAKVKPGYANFAIADPPLKLVLFEGPEGATINHLGVEVESAEEVVSAERRLTGAGLETTGVDRVAGGDAPSRCSPIRRRDPRPGNGRRSAGRRVRWYSRRIQDGRVFPHSVVLREPSGGVSPGRGSTSCSSLRPESMSVNSSASRSTHIDSPKALEDCFWQSLQWHA